MDALDVWTMPETRPERTAWLLEVARRSDPDHSDWVVLARDPGARQDRKALDQLARTAPEEAEFVPLFVSIAADLWGGGGDPIPLLRRVQEAHPSNFWANHYLATDLLAAGRQEEAVRYAQAAVALRPDFVGGYVNLGSALVRTSKMSEAISTYRAGVRLDPTSLATQFNLGFALARDGRTEEGIAYFEEALRLAPQSGLLHFGLGYSLAIIARYDEALAEYRRAIALEPKRKGPHVEMRRLLHRLGRRDEAGAAWADYITADPESRDAWEGFAEYCLFLDREKDYHRARRHLFDRFGETAQFREAERIGRACLLRPSTPEETKLATALIDRALADPQMESQKWVYPYFMFTKGLAEYRLDRFGSALTIMQGEASVVLKPGPQLVEAMALHRSERQEEARRTLASAISGYDWKDARVDDREAWIYHALRREAEDLILGSGRPAKDK